MSYSVTECVCGERHHMPIKRIPSPFNPFLDTHLAVGFDEQRAWVIAHREHAGPHGIRWIDSREAPPEPSPG